MDVHTRIAKAAPEDAIIQVEGLVKKYGDFTAVGGIHFEVHKGEIFGLLGPNGAGKTTTMEMIEGLRMPDEGTALVAGFNTRTQLGRVKEVIGVQLQSTSLFDLLTVRELMEMYASFYRRSLPIAPLIESMQLNDKLHARVKNLSGGQKQRLAIALALVNDPQVVFLDEPTTGLDPQARRSLWDIVLKLKAQGKTIVLSTHYMDEAHMLCDRICLMDGGGIIAIDTPAGLIKQLSSESAIEFRLVQDVRIGTTDVTGSGQEEAVTRPFAAIHGVKQVELRKDHVVLYTDTLQESLVDFVQMTAANGIQFTDLQTRTATLEDVFIQMTGRSLRE